MVITDSLVAMANATIAHNQTTPAMLCTNSEVTLSEMDVTGGSSVEFMLRATRPANSEGDDFTFAYSTDDVTDNILRRMHDYVHYITPQFSLTDINFQRVPTVDTSNPFVARDIPTADESLVVIRFRDPAKFDIDFPYLLSMLHDSFMSRRNSIVVPGGKMGLAMEIIFAPILDDLMNRRRASLKVA